MNYSDNSWIKWPMRWSGVKSTVVSKYPQFAEIVSIANKFCDAGGHAMMLEVIEASADYDETYPSMLNHFFKGIDGWMA